VTSDSLAGESLKDGGDFGKGNPKAAASKQPSSSTNTNNTDTSGAKKLDAAVDAQTRDDESQPKSSAGLGKESGVGPTYNTLGSSVNSSGTDRGVSTGTSGGADVQGNIAPTGAYAHTAQDLGKPKGKNITEDPNLEGKTEFGEVGTDKDPGRQAELEFAKRDAAAPGASNRDIAQGGDSKFSGLESESRI
jgi:hypothetical protein